MPTPPIRTITLGLADSHPLTSGAIQRASTILKSASARYRDAGYEVQTVRLSTRSIFDDLVDWPPKAIIDYIQELQRMLDDVGVSFCSLGTAHAARPDFPLERIGLIADILAPTNALNATVQLATQQHGLRQEAALTAAEVMKRLAYETAEGFGNFRFAILACVAPGSPFFPSAYHEGPISLSLGLQGASIVAEAFLDQKKNNASPIELTDVAEMVKAHLIERASPVVALGQTLASDFGLNFGGIDLSPAPLGDDSIVSALELSGYGPIGSSGTVALAAALTSALKGTELPTCGYCGLMLPVLEDATLGQRWEQGLVTTHELLLYSAVCGTGLDTVPLPGDIASADIAHLLCDVATLALRLNKPLSARLFPVPGKKSGQRTEFTSPYLTNTLVR
ncbi:MAG TPA: DUF711 family protein, partial [Ktedonobacteraceae bacterium]|nr:DUF711 family protein [Ktedonobacteraceae bacterium]